MFKNKIYIIIAALFSILVSLPSCAVEDSVPVPQDDTKRETSQEKVLSQKEEFTLDRNILKRKEVSIDHMKHIHRWADEAGDVQRFSNEPNWVRPDAVAMYAAAENGFLHLAVELKEGLISELTAQIDDEGRKRGTDLANFFLDTDNDLETGEHDFFVKERKGFEYEIDVLFGFFLYDKTIRGSYRIVGGASFPMKDITDVSPMATCWIIRLHDGNYHDTIKIRWKAGKPWSLDDPLEELSTINGDIVEVRIPYTLLGLKKGDTIRIAAKEPNDDLEEKGYLGETELLLQ